MPELATCYDGMHWFIINALLLVLFVASRVLWYVTRDTITLVLWWPHVCARGHFSSVVPCSAR